MKKHFKIPKVFERHSIYQPRFSVEPYTDEDLHRIRSTFLTSNSYAHNAAADFNRWRDATIIMIASILGLRPGETLSLKWNMIDWGNNEIHIDPYSNKNRSTTPIVLNRKAKNILLTWNSLSTKYINCQWVFPSLLTFEPLTTSGYAKRLRQISKEAGVYKILWYTDAGQPIGNKRFYSARKYFGTKFWHEKKDAHLLKRALRHTKLSSQDSYVYTDKESVKAAMDEVFN